MTAGKCRLQSMTLMYIPTVLLTHNIRMYKRFLYTKEKVNERFSSLQKWRSFSYIKASTFRSFFSSSFN